ncbi:hypothetical protein SLS60_005852 [Paraconiothyrium brasiliense]|uniref:Ubiquitin-like domain-containing protein n=1 Tax=Paraconiothyrium brasiliense TaxID=300254 RepID=A0ABR3RDC9_9PLEO
MASPGFGFSVGDFIAVIKLIGQVTKALQDTDGATDDFRMLQQELNQLQVLLEHLQELPPSSAESFTHYNAVRGMALTVQHPLRQLLDKMTAYSALEIKSSASKWRRAKQEIQWTVGMQKEIVRVRGIVTMKIVSLTTLLVLPLGGALRRIEVLSLQQSALSNQTRNDIEFCQQRIERDGARTRQVLSDRARSANMDSRRLLQICAGLDVGVRSLRASIETATSRQETELTLQLQHRRQFYGAMEVAATNLQSHASKTLALVETLLKKFTTFSYEMLAGLKDIHHSNIEIYSLLSLLDARLRRSPTNMLDDNITFIDVLNRKQSLPYSAFQYWEVFEAMLICQLKGTPAEAKVLRGDYRIFNAKTETVIDFTKWKDKVFPGASLDMSVVMMICRVRGKSCPRPYCQGETIKAEINETRAGPRVWYVFTK